MRRCLARISKFYGKLPLFSTAVKHRKICHDESVYLPSQKFEHVIKSSVSEVAAVKIERLH